MRLSFVFVGLLLAVPACSSNESPTPKGDGGATTATDAGSSAQDAGHGGMNMDSGGSMATPAAPQITAVSKMMGALHVMWTNKEPACDTIEGERKTATAAYAVAFTVPGDADNKHDTAATQPTAYTYRLRCKKAGMYSAYSNEMSGTP